MTESGQSRTQFSEEDRTALVLLRHLCATIGSANDADDHGYSDDARRMREESVESIRNLAAQHPFISERFPTLERDIETGRIFIFAWSEICNAASALLNGSSDDDGNARHDANERRHTMQNGESHEALRTQCGTCSGLKDEEYAFLKCGRQESSTSLPAAAGSLEIVRDFKPLSSRALQLRRCPECGAYFLYRSDYEYLTNGTEDEEFLTRLTDEQVAEWLERPVQP